MQTEPRSLVVVSRLLVQKPNYLYHPRSQVSGSVCVCLSFQAITFEPTQLGILFFSLQI